MESKDDNKENIPPITFSFSPSYYEGDGSYRIEFRGTKRPLSPIKEEKEKVLKREK